MPSVFSISGTEPKRCKWVTNSRTGCRIKLCYVGKSKKAPSGWQFQKGTTECPRR